MKDYLIKIQDELLEDLWQQNVHGLRDRFPNHCPEMVELPNCEQVALKDRLYNNAWDRMLDAADDARLLEKERGCE